MGSTLNFQGIITYFLNFVFFPRDFASYALKHKCPVARNPGSNMADLREKLKKFI
jgi:hypothetical protein